MLFNVDPIWEGWPSFSASNYASNYHHRFAASFFAISQAVFAYVAGNESECVVKLTMNYGLIGSTGCCAWISPFSPNAFLTSQVERPHLH